MCIQVAVGILPIVPANDKQKLVLKLGSPATKPAVIISC
jgi:hypothetical protein